MKRYIHEKSAVDMLHEFESKLDEVNSCDQVNAAFDAIEEDLPDGYESWEEEPEDEYWMLVDRKDVQDYDGFWTKYSLYRLMPYDDQYVTIFGDPDLYRPEDGDFDAEFDSEEEAYEFFNDYEGFVDEEDF